MTTEFIATYVYQPESVELTKQLTDYSLGNISRKEAEALTGLWCSELFIEMRKRGLQLPRVDATLNYSPEQKETFSRLFKT